MPAVWPLKAPARAASRASRPVCGVADGLRDVLRTDMALSCRARGEYAGAGCLSYHQAAGGKPATCLRGQLDLTSSHKDCPRHAAARCGRGWPEVFCKTSRRVLTEGSIIARDAPRTRTLAVAMALGLGHCSRPGRNAR